MTDENKISSELVDVHQMVQSDVGKGFMKTWLAAQNLLTCLFFAFFPRFQHFSQVVGKYAHYCFNNTFAAALSACPTARQQQISMQTPAIVSQLSAGSGALHNLLTQMTSRCNWPCPPPLIAHSSIIFVTHFVASASWGAQDNENKMWLEQAGVLSV